MSEREDATDGERGFRNDVVPAPQAEFNKVEIATSLEKAAEQMEKIGVRQEVVRENIDFEKMFHELARKLLRCDGDEDAASGRVLTMFIACVRARLLSMIYTRYLHPTGESPRANRSISHISSLLTF
jgi:hypothetical protein